MTLPRVLFACGIIVGAFTASAQADSCRLTRLASLPFTGTRAIIVPALIDGQPVPMVLDTGAPESAIDPVIAKTLDRAGRELFPQSVYDGAGQAITHTAIAHELSLSGAHASDVHFLVWPTPLSPDGSRRGTLAADLLQHYDVEIDFSAHRVNLFSQNHCEGKVVYWTSGSVAVVPMHVTWAGHITVPVTLDGQSFDALLDTGSSHSILFQNAAIDRFQLKPDTPEMRKIGTLGGPDHAPVYRHDFKTLDLEGLSIRNPEIEIFERPRMRIRGSDPSGNNDLILGLSELRHLHIYIAYAEEKLYVSPASAPILTKATGATAAQAASTSVAH